MKRKASLTGRVEKEVIGDADAELLLYGAKDLLNRCQGLLEAGGPFEEAGSRQYRCLQVV